MLQGGSKRKFKGIKFDMTQAVLRLFDKLKQRFASALMLIHYNPSRQIMLECDVSGFAIGAILSQLVSETSIWHPVEFWSRKIILAERNYGASKAEMLAIVCACKHWRHYLEGATYGIRVVTNHLNLHKFLTTKTLLRRETRWWEVFSSLDLAIEYCEGKNNQADGPFQHPDYMDKDDKPFYIVSYVTCSSSKCKLAQAV